MQADLAERDSLIRVLQHHSSLSRASSISSLLAASSQCASPRLSPQQQHRSPVSLVLHAAAAGGSKPSSCSSSRQSSQLSAGSLSLNKNTKLGSYMLSPRSAELVNPTQPKISRPNRTHKSLHPTQPNPSSTLGMAY